MNDLKHTSKPKPTFFLNSLGQDLRNQQSVAKRRGKWLSRAVPTHAIRCCRKLNIVTIELVTEISTSKTSVNNNCRRGVGGRSLGGLPMLFLAKGVCEKVSLSTSTCK